MRLSLDIWHEIIKYFEYPRDNETLCSLAVTSRNISNLALDTVWRKDKTVEDIVSVINSFAPSPNDPFLHYIQDEEYVENDDEDPSPPPRMIGSWALNKPLPSAACKRVLEYLARIRELCVCQDGSLSQNEPVWPILSACLNSHGPLLPNLRRLDIDLLIYDRNEYLIPLLSPSLKILLISSELPPKLNAVLSTVNLAKASGCDLEDFTYLGPPTYHVLEAITSFKTLRNLEFPLDRPQRKVSTTVVQFLSSLPSLCSFTCNIGAFSPCTDEDRLCHTSLQNIQIKSTPVALGELFCRCSFPSVTNVGIVFNEIPSMQGIESSCPNTSRLVLRASGATNNPPLEFKHLASLLSLSMQSFHLLVKEHNLTPSHLHSFAKSWPNISFLKISSNTLFDPIPSLAAFSNHPCLDYLDVPLPLFRLLDGIPKVPGLARSGQSSHNTPLRSLFLHYEVNHPRQTPVSTLEKYMVAEYLLRLFPSLNELKVLSAHCSHGDKLGDFREVLLELRKQM